MLKVSNLTKKYGNRKVLNNVSISFPKSGFIAIVGPSGCGKTTLLNIIAGIDIQYEGQVAFKNSLIKEFSAGQRSNYRLMNLGYVFQDFRLFELDTVYDNLLLPLEQVSQETKSIKNHYLTTILDLVGLKDKKMTKVNLLSGGEKQRIAIARALVNDPSLILCDEPTGSLDEENANSIMNLLVEISVKKLVIMVTHDEAIADKYCHRKIRLIDGSIVENASIKHLVFKSKMRVGKNGKGNTPRPMPIRTMIRRAFSILKTRKYRLIINNTMMSLGLLGVGLSIIMAFSINQKIVSGFSSIINDGMIIMSNKYEDNGIIKGYSASYENVLDIKNKYAEFIDSIGVSYAVNFETFFQDRDELFISSTSHKIILPRFTSRQINDFLWLDNKNEQYLVYPQTQATLEDDSFVIGLPYNDMVGICYSLKVQRNYQSLGDYIRINKPLVTLGLANDSWGYEDEQIFHLVGVIETDAPTIFHSNHLWSEYVFQEKMRLPSVDDGNYIFPWEIAKTYFVTTRKTIEDFLEKALLEKALGDYIFELAGKEFHPTICPLSGPCFSDRLLVFHVDSNALKVSQLASILKRERNLANYTYATEGGYYYHPGSFIAGFAKNLLLSFSETQIELAIDGDNLIDEETSNFMIELPDGVLQGSFHTSLSDGVGFSSDMSKLIIGHKPDNLSEIVVSEGLMKKLGFTSEIIGKTMQIAVNYENIAYDNNRFEKHYSLSQVNIVGIAKGDHISLHHNPYWSIGFFQLYAGVSAFELIPKHIIFEVEDGEDSKVVIDNLIKSFPDFRFSNPMASVQEGIDETMSLLRIVLLSFSSLAIITSLFLFFLVMFVTIEENKNDIFLMHYLGISKRDIRNSFIVCGFLVSGFSFALASIEITVSDFVINHIIAGYLGTNIPYVFNPVPLLAILFLSIFMAYSATYFAFQKHYHQGQKKETFFIKIIKKDR